MIWLHGNDDAFRGMNGIEMNDKLDKLEAKFGEWYNRNVYDDQLGSHPPLHLYKRYRFACSVWRKLKDSVYKKHSSEKDSMGDADIEEVCGMFLIKPVKRNTFRPL